MWTKQNAKLGRGLMMIDDYEGKREHFFRFEDEHEAITAPWASK